MSILQWLYNCHCFFGQTFTCQVEVTPLVKQPVQNFVGMEQRNVSFAGMDIIGTGALIVKWCHVGWLKKGGRRVRTS
eukprot:1146510-Pelagomonas_calceolata.AAC.5